MVGDGHLKNKGNHKVVTRQLSIYLSFHPLFDFMVLTCRAMAAVTAGSELNVLNMALGAFGLGHKMGHPGEGSGLRY